MEKNSKGLIFEPHRITSDSVMDVPFRIKGHKLRWISGYVQSISSHRAWKQLKIDDIPPETLKKLKTDHFGLFSNDGATIRYGENVLAYMSLEQFDKVQADKQQRAHDQMGQVMTPSNKNVKVDKAQTKFENKVSREFFDQ